MANQPLLFNPDLHPMQYALENGAIEITFDERLMTFWVTQKQMTEMFNLDVRTVSQAVARFKRERPEDIETAIRSLRITASDGKSYNVEHYNHSVAMSIAYRAHATKQAVAFQRYAETAFQEKMERDHARAIKKVQHGRDVKRTGYILDGMSESHAQTRMDVTDTFNQLRGIIAAISKPQMIGRVVGREYMLLFGKLTDELKRILNTTNIRDELPEFQLTYVKMAEETLVMMLSQKEALTEQELISIVDKTVRPLGEHLKMICDSLSIDIVTGRKQLGRGS